MKIVVISLGCAKNLVDTENLLGILRESKIEIIDKWQGADAAIINTCGFIDKAKEEAISTILDAVSYKEQGLKKIVVMGCLAKRYKPELEQEFPEVDRFISIDEYGDLGRILSETLGVKIVNTYGKSPRVLSGKTWMAYMRIADGCDNRCSYCAIPNIRGSYRSVPQDDLVTEAERLVRGGVKELNLIAQDSSRYGVDIDGNLHLSDLLKKLDRIEGIHWIRILYLYPDEIPDDLIETIKGSEHVLPYFDIPIQHVNDRLLKLMHRRGTQATIVDRVNQIRNSLEHPILRTTLIAGFPTETLAEHLENVRMVKELKWDHLGVFAYSHEEGTPSYAMTDDVPSEEKERRCAEIMAAQDVVVEKARKAWIGEKDEVLIEGRDPLTSMYLGRSAMFAPDGVDGTVRFHGLREHEAGEFVQVIYKKVSGQNMIADEVNS